MISRREVSIALALGPFVFARKLRALEDDVFWAVPTEELTVPGEINPLNLFGSKPPKQQERETAQRILRSAPTGPRPIDVARYFLDGAKVDAHYIEQWPRSDSWNPLIVEFFSATNYTASSDMVPWCAAFVNWCLERAERPGSRSPSSQSFINSPHFVLTAEPKIGDLAIFSCHRITDNAPIGLGHVGFLAAAPAGEQLQIIGGNQSKSGKSGIISMAQFPKESKIFDRCIYRSHSGTCSQIVKVRLRINGFVKIV